MFVKGKVGQHLRIIQNKILYETTKCDPDVGNGQQFLVQPGLQSLLLD